MNIGIINGPNLNLLGVREPEIYGSITFPEYLDKLRKFNSDFNLHFFQSNHEGDLIDKIQAWGFEMQGILINPGGYSHVSIALADAIRSVPATVIEVHLSNIHARETYRAISVTAAATKGIVSGFGLHSYHVALQYFRQA